MDDKGDIKMGHAILIDIFNDVKEPTRMIKTNTTKYGEVKGYGCTVLPCLSPDEINNMYAAAYSAPTETPIKIMYLNNRKSYYDKVKGCQKTR